MRSPREVAILVRRGDEVLLVRRVRDGAWNVPAGQVEASEQEAVAARRELREETGLDADAVDLGLSQRYRVPGAMRAAYPAGLTHVRIETFVAQAPPGWEPVLNEEHDAYRWCALGEALGALRWPEMRHALEVLAHRDPDQWPGT